MAEGNDRVTTREFYDKLMDVEHRIMDKLEDMELRNSNKLDTLFPCNEVVRIGKVLDKHEERLDGGDRANKIIAAIGSVATMLLAALK